VGLGAAGAGRGSSHKMPLADSVKALKSKLSGEIYGAGYRKFSKSTDELITFSKGTFKYCLRLLALGLR
jgi:hypothetical protein